MATDVEVLGFPIQITTGDSAVDRSIRAEARKQFGEDDSIQEALSKLVAMDINAPVTNA